MPYDWSNALTDYKNGMDNPWSFIKERFKGGKYNFNTPLDDYLNRKLRQGGKRLQDYVYNDVIMGGTDFDMVPVNDGKYSSGVTRSNKEYKGVGKRPANRKDKPSINTKRASMGNPIPKHVYKSPKSRYRHYTNGLYGGKFTGHVNRQVPSAALSGCVLKGEKQGTLTDTTCVYLGHCSVPLTQMFRAIGWSIARLVAKMWKQDFPSYLAPVNGPDAANSCNIRCTITYRTTMTGPCTDKTWTDTASTWGELGDNIVHKIIEFVPSGANFFDIVRLKFANIDATAIESLQTIVLNAHHLRIAISGYSCLRVQNTTVSTTADTLANESKDDIANNPLCGRQYFGKGMYHLYRYNNDYSTSIPALYYETNDGYLTLSAAAATSIEVDMLNYMKKPPNFKAFSNMKGDRKVMLAPGEIKTSHVKSNYSYPLTKWVRILLPAMSGASGGLGSVGSSGGGQFISLGKNSVLGLEHSLHAGTEPDITVHYQIDWTVTGVAKYKSKQYCVPDVGTSIYSKIAAE